MSDLVTVKLDGLKELDAKLAAMGSDLGFKALRGAMMAASTPMFKDAKANAAATGAPASDATAAAMGRWTRKTSETKTTLFMGPRNKNKKARALYEAYYGRDFKRLSYFHLTEFGTVRSKAQPFLRPAFQSNAPVFLRNFAAELRKSIERVARRAK